MVSARTAAALLAALAGGLALWTIGGALSGRQLSRLSAPADRWRSVLRRAVDEGRVEEAFGGRRLLAVSVAAGAFAGWSALGPAAAPLGMLVTPALLRAGLRQRRRRYAARVDACAPDLALALASALSAGRSVRGALLTAGAATPDPLAAELDRLAIDLTLGAGLSDALGSLRERTASPRIDSLTAAIELHRGSGGDLVRLTRELAAAFRARDRALRDAHAASAQARFTAIVVAAIPIVFCAALELTRPGAVSGALRLLPTALMLAIAVALIGAGVALSLRLAGSGDP
jgi:tight adherence protein B